MVRKLELDAVRGDLAVITDLLARRTVDEDPIGFFQFSERAVELGRKIAALEQSPEHNASLAVFFAGAPVQGSKGIRADFAGKAVHLLQDLVSKQFATDNLGSIAEVGPIPLRSNSDLLLTDLARGSVGLILEEANQNESLTESELSVAIHKVTQDIARTAEQDSGSFEEFLGEVDYRYFASLSALFKHLDESRATVRLVETDTDFELDAQAIHRARERTDAAVIQDDDDVRRTGRLFLLPAMRRFELSLLGTGEVIHGTVAPEFAREHLEHVRTTAEVVNRDWVVRLKSRTINRPNKDAQTKYMLRALIEPAPANAPPPDDPAATAA